MEYRGRLPDGFRVRVGPGEPEVDCSADKFADRAVLALRQAAKPAELGFGEEDLELFHGYSISMEGVSWLVDLQGWGGMGG